MTDTRARVLEMLAESGIEAGDSADLASCLAELDVFLDDTPPEPSPELAALMANLVATPAPLQLGRSGRRRTRLFIAGAAALGAVGAGGIAAAANELPSGAQTIVAKFSERFLPFELPHPDGSRVPLVEPTEAEPTTTVAHDPTPRPTGGSATTSTGTTTAPTADASVAPSSAPEAAPTAGAGPTGSASPSPAASASPSEGQSPQGSGSPQAGGDASAAPDPQATPTPAPSEPAADPSGSGSPTANTRTEVTDSPSPSPSTAPSPASSSAPTASAGPTTAVWSDPD